MPGLKPRAKTLVELAEAAQFYVAPRPLALDAAAQKLLDAPARARLGRLRARYAGLTDWSAAALESELRALAEAEGAKLGELAQPLRAALAGKTVTPPIFDVLAALGREESLARIDDVAPR